MTKTNETIADIIAEMRGGPIPQHRRDQELLRHYADRLEAAWKHEKTAIEADALAVGGLVEASRKQKPTTEKSSAVGDAAKLREALIKAQIALKVCDWPEGTDMDGVAKIIREIDDALAAPPRNCDRFGTDNAEASLAYEEFCDRAEVEESANGAIAWLLSLDTGRKGGAK